MIAPALLLSVLCAWPASAGPNSPRLRAIASPARLTAAAPLAPLRLSLTRAPTFRSATRRLDKILSLLPADLSAINRPASLGAAWSSGASIQSALEGSPERSAASALSLPAVSKEKRSTVRLTPSSMTPKQRRLKADGISKTFKRIVKGDPVARKKLSHLLKLLDSSKAPAIRFERKPREIGGAWAEWVQESNEIILNLKLTDFPEPYLAPPLAHELQHAYDRSPSNSRQEEVRTHKTELIVLAAVERYLKKLMMHYRKDYAFLLEQQRHGRLEKAVELRYGPSAPDLKVELKVAKAQERAAQKAVKSAKSGEFKRAAKAKLAGLQALIKEMRENMRKPLKRS